MKMWQLVHTKESMGMPQLNLWMSHNEEGIEIYTTTRAHATGSLKEPILQPHYHTSKEAVEAAVKNADRQDS